MQKTFEFENEILKYIHAYHGNNSPGLIIGCANSRSQYLYCFGTQDGVTPIDAADAFDIASVTKAFTNVLALKLIPVEDLDQKVISVLPMKGKYRDMITVRHLLTFGLEFGGRF
ncbi:MAG: serine hydrolase [Sphingomonadales bacterium]